MLGIHGGNVSSRGQLLRAREAARRALEIDDRLSAGHAALGYFRLFYEWDFPGARRAFERAVQLNPSYTSALAGYASYLLLVEGQNMLMQLTI